MRHRLNTRPAAPGSYGVPVRPVLGLHYEVRTDVPAMTPGGWVQRLVLHAEACGRVLGRARGTPHGLKDLVGTRPAATHWTTARLRATIRPWSPSAPG